jgi:ABC-type multidrug transport system ATPase subunit
VNQVPYIIEGFSVRENLMLGVFEKVSDKKIVELLEKFHLKKKIFKNRQ